MDDVTTYALAGVVVVLAIVVAIATRRRRDRSLDPVRLGPSWTPPGSDPRGGRPGAAEALRDDDRVERVRDRTGLDDETVATVLIAWDELLSVLGYRSLPADHRYRVYDPYDPPIPSRGADNRPVADPVRVARDVDRRTGVAEIDARTVLDALLEDPAARPGRVEATTRDGSAEPAPGADPSGDQRS